MRRRLLSKRGNGNSGAITDTTGLLAYFKKDETSGNLVSSVNGFVGTPNGAVTLGQEGKIGSSVNYNGGHIDLTGLTSTSKNYTFFWWAKITQTALQFFFDTQSGRLAIANSPGITTASSGVAYYDNGWKGFASGSTTANTGWRFYALVLNNTTQKGQGFIDGAATGTEQPYIGRNIGGSTRFGRAIDGGAAMSNGNIDEFGIYERCLTASEILELYNNGNGKTL